jgi:hypothetical protein
MQLNLAEDDGEEPECLQASKIVNQKASNKKAKAINNKGKGKRPQPQPLKRS